MYILDHSCSSSEFKCPDSYCIESNLKCNGIPDCPNGEDESGCSGMFKVFKNIIENIVGERQGDSTASVILYKTSTKLNLPNENNRRGLGSNNTSVIPTQDRSQD